MAQKFGTLVVTSEFDSDDELKFAINGKYVWVKREEVASLIAHLQGCLKPADNTPICDEHASIFLKRDEDGNILLVDANGKPLSCVRIDVCQSTGKSTIVTADIYTQGWFDEQ